MAFIAGQQQQQHEGVKIAPIGRGKCTAAWRKADGDVKAAKAALLAWTAKRHQRHQQRNKDADLDMAKLLQQLDRLGFGARTNITGANDDDVFKAKKVSERIQKRNERLIKRFGGELSQVVGFLEARQAKVDLARKTAVRASRGAQAERRCARRQEKKHQHQEQVAVAL
jgi:hypothetical protein